MMRLLRLSKCWDALQRYVNSDHITDSNVITVIVIAIVLAACQCNHCIL
jgi:hypothetical protein